MKKREPVVLNKRTAGVPDGAVYVGRPSRWGNPFRGLDKYEAIYKHRRWLLGQPALVGEVRKHLAGKDLVCWCAPAACHAHTLLWVANAPRELVIAEVRNELRRREEEGA